MSSIEPDYGSSQKYSGEEVPCGFIVTGGDCTILLEFGEEILDQVTGRVEMAIECPGLLPVGLGWDHHGLSGCGQRLDHALVGIEGLVGDERIGCEVGQEFVGTDEIVGLSAGQTKTGWITERIGQCVDFGAQSAARSPDRLVLADFFWAPALC